MFCSSVDWLEAHHSAKLPERQAFAERLAAQQPKRLIDLGCGVGLWLELLDGLLPSDCEFVGMDLDSDALDRAAERAQRWDRTVTFERIDLNTELDAIPSGDMTLAFNVFPYVNDPAQLIQGIANAGGSLAIRQYDGAALRFGPIDSDLRTSIEDSLRNSFAVGDEFRHYDLDRVMRSAATSQFAAKELSFELFARTAPFPSDFRAYYEGMLAWTLSRLSDNIGERFKAWLHADEPVGGRYFFEVDLVALLSGSDLAQRQRCSN